MRDPREFSKLEQNWDGYGAKQISEQAIETASKIREYMALVPMNNGGIQLECHAGGMDIEIEIDAKGKLKGVFVETVDD